MRASFSHMGRALVMSTLLAVSLLVTPVTADAHYRHGCCWGGWGLGVGLGVGALWAYPYAYGPYPYYATVPETIVVQQPPAVMAPAAQSYYYCQTSNAYYPYVQTCSTPWQAVSAIPPVGH